MRKTLWDGGTWGWRKAQGCRNALGWRNTGMDEGSGMQERSAPVFHPFPKESGPARRKGRARAATQRCPAGTPGQGHRGHPRGDTRTGTPGQGHPTTDPSPDPLISLQPLHPQGSPPGISPPAPHSQGIPAQGSPPAPLAAGIPCCRTPSQPFYPQEFSSRLCARRNPRSEIPPEPLPPQGSLLRDPHSSPSVLRDLCSGFPAPNLHSPHSTSSSSLWDSPPTPPSSRISPPAPPDFSSSPPSPSRAQLPVPCCHP